MGLTVTSPKGQTWSFDPHTSGLDAAEGGFETSLGWFGAKWTLERGGKRFTATLDVPEGTSGAVRVPIGGSVSVSGERVDKDTTGMVHLVGGKHTIVAG